MKTLAYNGIRFNDGCKTCWLCYSSIHKNNLLFTGPRTLLILFPGGRNAIIGSAIRTCMDWLMVAFLLPYRHDLLEPIDRNLDGIKARLSVRRTNAYNNACLTNGHHSKPMINGHVFDVGPLHAQFIADLLHRLQCHAIVGLVFERCDLLGEMILMLLNAHSICSFNRTSHAHPFVFEIISRRTAEKRNGSARWMREKLINRIQIEHLRL